jgi:hypothetical protein
MKAGCHRDAGQLDEAVRVYKEASGAYMRKPVTAETAKLFYF